MRLTPCCTPRHPVASSRRYGGQNTCQTPSRTPRRSANTASFCAPPASPSRGRGAPRHTLLEGIRRNNANTVSKVLDEDPFAVCRPILGTQEPPLILALHACTSVEVFSLLLQGGADVHARSSVGLTPLETVVGVQAVADIGGGISGTWSLGRPEFFTMPGSHSSFTKEAVSEDKCIAYASLLLWHGASKSGQSG